jgi:hypothetical protein
MALLTRDALMGASDLVEREIELPSIGGSVRIRSLPAAYSNQAQSEALEMVTGRSGEQTARVNTGKLEALQVLHGLIEPKFENVDEVLEWAQHVGPAWKTIVREIDAISGIDKEAIEKTNATFLAGGQGKTSPAVGNGVTGGSGGPDLPARTGARVGNAGR